MSTWLASWLAGAASFAGMAALALAMDRHYLQSTGNDEVPRLQRQVLRSVGAVLLAAVFIPCVQAWGGTVGMVVSLGFWSLGHWTLSQGRFYSDAEDRDLAPLVVLGHKAHAHFFPDVPNPLGRQLIIGNSAFEVIGVMNERGAESGAQNYDEMVFIPYHSGRARVYQTQTQPDYVVIEAASTEQVHDAEAAMRTLLTARHGGREDFGIGNAAARIQAEAATRQSMAMMLGLIAAVSLLVGGIGVMNVMLMTVRERTREIGIRMAVGARQRDILRQFLTEASLVTVVGGSVGLLAGLAVGAVLMVASVPVVFSVRAMLGAFACAVITGLVFGYMPAKTAARLDPVRALAGE